MGAKVEVLAEKGRLFVKSPFEAKELAKTIPGYLWDKDSKRWNYPATATTAAEILSRYTTNGYEVGVDMPTLELAAKAKKQVAANEFKTRDDLPEIPGRICNCIAGPQPGKSDEGTNPFKCVSCGESIESFQHQRQAHYFARDHDGVLLAVGMGGGKTKNAIALLDEWDAKRVLIVCPKNVVAVWPKEFPVHSEREWRVESGRKIKANGEYAKNTSIKDRATKIHGAISGYGRGPVAVVVNYEASWQGDLSELLLSTEWDAIVLDESHRIKAPGGAASKFIARLRDRTERRICLTGTPQPHSPLDIYAQARFIDPGVFGTNFQKFRKRYAVMKDIYAPGGRTVSVVDGYQNEQELAEKIASFSFIISQDELDKSLGLEEPTDLIRNCTLGANAAKVYRDVWNEFAVDLDEGVVTAANVLTRLLRVQQITSGHLPLDSVDPSDRRVVEIDTSKKDLLADVFEDLPQSKDGFAPVVVFARFTHDLESIRKVAEQSGRKYGELSGRDKGGMTDAATMRDDIDVLGVQMQAGGVGVDFTRAAHAIYYSLGFSLGDYLQSRKRVHRPGQLRHVTYTHLVAEGTIDEIVYQTLLQRQEVVDAVMKAAKAA